MEDDVPQSHPLRGRNLEWQQIVGVVAAAGRRRASVLVVNGCEGMGKTRILGELGRAARDAGCTVLADEHHLAADPAALPVRALNGTRRIDLVVVVRDGSGPAWPLNIATDRSILWATTHVTAGRSRCQVPNGVATTVVELRPLMPAAVAEIVTDLVDARPSTSLLDLVAAAAGNPRAVVEMVTGLDEENLLERANGLVRPKVVTLPRRTRLRLHAQLDGSSEQARHLVQVASAVGVSFQLSQVSRLLRVSGASLAPAVVEALARRALVADGDRLAFPHGLVRDVVAATLPAAAFCSPAWSPACRSRRTP